MKTFKDKFEVESHPFADFIPNDATHLIIGTFPTFKENLQYKFHYSGKDNLFWSVIEKVFECKFRFNEGEVAEEERRALLKSKNTGVTDMHLKCYRKNGQSADECLYPIILKDILMLLDAFPAINTLVFTSRTEICGAWGLFKTHLIQKNVDPPEVTKRIDKILEGQLNNGGKKYQIYVPYSPSPRLIKEGITTKEELVRMYKFCFSTNIHSKE